VSLLALAPAGQEVRDLWNHVLLSLEWSCNGIRTWDEVMLNSRFSYESVKRLAADHGERMVSSLDADWNTLIVEARKKPATVDLWEPPRLQISL
jgi:hypothetical protein